MNPKVAILDTVDFPNTDHHISSRLARELYVAMLADPSHVRSSLVGNVQTKTRLLRVENELLPVTWNTDNYADSWVCSPFNAAITYPLEELRVIRSRILRGGLSGLIHCLAPFLKWGRINHVVCINNWLLSTNLYPDLPDDAWAAVTDLLQQDSPRSAILLRSLNHRTNGPLIQELQRLGYLLAPSRQVYFYDGRNPDYLHRHNTQIDLKLLDRDDLTPVTHEEFSEVDDARVRELYEMLYLQKYSSHNPQFMDRLIAIWRKTGLLKLFGLRNSHGRLDAVVGTFALNGVVTAPLVGYDTTLPQSLGLYRRLMAYVLRMTARDKLLLNLSAGAAGFKRLRGGQPEIEYSAVFCQHLPWRGRVVWRTLASLLKHVGARLLQRYEL